ncbi:MAG TPA: hypothetical protein V6C91_00270 [Coleofasciculaceae cyanobacterium]
MQLRQLMRLLIASVSASSLLLAGCSRQRNFDEVQPTPLSSSTYTQDANLKT